MKRHLICTLFLSTFLVFKGFGQLTEAKYPNVEIGGYIKYLGNLVKVDAFGISDVQTNQLFHHRLNLDINFQENLKLEVGWRNQFYFGELVKMNPGFADNLRDQQNDYLSLSWNPINEESYFLNSTLDRLYLEWYSDQWELSLGRQRINWGISTTWNPHDIFNAYSFVDFDYEERPGSDAFLARLYYGETSSAEIAIKMADNIKDLVFGALWKFNRNLYDFQVLTGYFKENVVLGAGWAGNLGNAGFKGEFSWFGSTNDVEKNSFILSTNLDYIFSNEWYINVGYLYNQRGASQSSILEVFSYDISAKNIYPFKHAILFLNTYPITPLLNVGMTLVYTPSSTHPAFLGPLITYSLAEDLDINFVGQLGLDNNEGYGSRFQAYYLRLKWSY